MQTSQESRRQLIQDFKIHESDSGSPEVQVALLTSRIQKVTEHLKKHKKDFGSRRGLLMMVGRRATLLKYVARVNRNRYLTLIQRLAIRR